METNKAVAEYRECLACGDKSCLSIISDCPKKYNIQHYQIEAYCAIAGSIPLARLEELCNAEREGRCVVLGDKVYGIISNYGYNPGEHVKMLTLGKTAFTTPAEADAALNKPEASK
jgi:hypothetical protein